MKYFLSYEYSGITIPTHNNPLSICQKIVSFIKKYFAGRTCVNGCPPLSSLHGVVSYNRSAIGGRYPVGTKGTYHCDVSLYSGSETRTCQRSGVWGGSPAICTKSKKHDNLKAKYVCKKLSFKFCISFTFSH